MIGTCLFFLMDEDVEDEAPTEEGPGPPPPTEEEEAIVAAIEEVMMEEINEEGRSKSPSIDLLKDAVKAPTPLS